METDGGNAGGAAKGRVGHEMTKGLGNESNSRRTVKEEKDKNDEKMTERKKKEDSRVGERNGVL